MQRLKVEGVRRTILWAKTVVELEQTYWASSWIRYVCMVKHFLCLHLAAIESSSVILGRVLDVNKLGLFPFVSTTWIWEALTRNRRCLSPLCRAKQTPVRKKTLFSSTWGVSLPRMPFSHKSSSSGVNSSAWRLCYPFPALFSRFIMASRVALSSA